MGFNGSRSSKIAFLQILFLVASVSAAKPSKDSPVPSSVSSDKPKTQTLTSRPTASEGAKKYGYPFAIAPSLMPIIHSRSDESETIVQESPAKAFVNKVLSSEKMSAPFKKAVQKKHKIPLRFGTSRRQGLDDAGGSLTVRRLGSYKEPTYRNFDDLENGFKPRRYDLEGTFDYGYSSDVSRKPSVSPRDPYLSPSHEPNDAFYPTVPKMKTYSGSYGERIRQPTSYGAGSYEETDNYYDHNPEPYDKHNRGRGSYNYDNHYSKDGYYGYEEDYTIEGNKPIVGDIRKRLLDYAGASADIYESEPDYLQQIASNKNKYGHIGNDYYSNGRVGFHGSYSGYPYVEPKLRIAKSRI